jgi:hypothetical protein
VSTVDEASARAFIRQHHYSHSYPAAIHRLAMRDTGGTLVGIAVFGVPATARVLTGPFPELQPYREAVELSRFVLLDTVAANGETWMLARCFEHLLGVGVRGVVSFADPVPRTTASGEVVTPGHVGHIYRAKGALYAGRATPRSLLLLPDGTVLNDRAVQKVRAQERGHEYVERHLVSFGARSPRAGQTPTVWLEEAVQSIGARRLRHAGNHRFLFPLGRNARERAQVRLGMPTSTLYPRRRDAAEESLPGM